jgi:anti-sigma regulatory factor (Ser/Thr protein kinase)
MGDLHAALGRFSARVDSQAPGGLDDRARLRLAIALGEIVGNVVRHAHEPGSRARFCLRLRFRTMWAEAWVVDGGAPFQRSSGPALAEPDDVEALAEGGRGLALARAAADRLGYRRRRGLNYWRIGVRPTA